MDGQVKRADAVAAKNIGRCGEVCSTLVICCAVPSVGVTCCLSGCIVAIRMDGKVERCRTITTKHVLSFVAVSTAFCVGGAIPEIWMQELYDIAS